MKDSLSKVLIFATGAAIGTVVTWKLLDAKYAQRAEKEIKEIKEYYEGKYSDSAEEGDPEQDYKEWAENHPDEVKEVKTEYANLVKNYTGEKGGSESMEIGTPPYVISPDEFDTEDDYETISLMYYTDGVLVDDEGYLLEDVENTVGKDFAAHFGEFEDDSVFIRNEVLKTDYEILMDYRPYTDVVQTATNLKDDE